MNSLKGSVARERKLINSSEPLEIRVWPTYLTTESTENASQRTTDIKKTPINLKVAIKWKDPCFEILSNFFKLWKKNI